MIIKITENRRKAKYRKEKEISYLILETQIKDQHT